MHVAHSRNSHSGSSSDRNSLASNDGKDRPILTISLVCVNCIYGIQHDAACDIIGNKLNQLICANTRVSPEMKTNLAESLTSQKCILLE